MSSLSLSEWLKARVDQPCLVQSRGFGKNLWDGSSELGNCLGNAPRVGVQSVEAFLAGVYGDSQIVLLYAPGLGPLKRLPLDLVWSTKYSPTLSARATSVYFFLTPPVLEPPSRKWPHICQCNAPALRMFSSIECSSPQCKFYVP